MRKFKKFLIAIGVTCLLLIFGWLGCCTSNSDEQFTTHEIKFKVTDNVQNNFNDENDKTIESDEIDNDFHQTEDK